MKRSITQRIAEQLELQDMCLPKQPVLEVYGNHRVLIENHVAVAEYGLQCITVQMKYGYVHISGNDLRISRLMEHQLVITGEVEMIKLQKG